MPDSESPAGSPAASADSRSEKAEGNSIPDEKEGDSRSQSGDTDKESDLLSEIDENQFEDYDPETANIEDRPVTIDDDVARTLKASKRRKAPGETKKPKEGRREKKRNRDDEMDIDGGEDASRPRKARRSGGEGSSRASPAPPREENITPEERRRRALERALDEATKGPQKRRKKKDETDLDDPVEEQINSLVLRMENACKTDNTAREAGQPAIHKLKLLPDVMNMLNRNTAQEAVLDPDSGFLRAIRFFLEPLLHDGSLPAYNIQRDIFTTLMNLPISKEGLLESGLGRVVFFYTKSKKPEVGIKRMAEKLVGNWSRPILKRTDDYKKRIIETREFDYQAAKLAQRQGANSQLTLSQRPATSSQTERDRLLAPVNTSNRARIPDLPKSYTVAPLSTFDGARGPEHRPIGAGGMEAFRKMTQKVKRRGG